MSRPEQAAPVTPGLAAYELGFRTEEALAEVVKAARHYDHDNRPRGNWGSVPDHQAARIIIGALRAMHQRDRATSGRVDGLVTDVNDLRALLAEILSHLEAAGIFIDEELLAAWHERAGLEADHA